MPGQKAAPKQQTRANHARFHAIFHFFFVPSMVLLILLAVYQVFWNPGLFTFSVLLLLADVAVVGLLARIYALKVQDRVIRLEEQLRLVALLPETLQSAVLRLSERQLIALRFAPDDEIPALVERVLSENLDSKSIKSSIQRWRPDHWRV